VAPKLADGQDEHHAVEAQKGKNRDVEVHLGKHKIDHILFIYEITKSDFCSTWGTQFIFVLCLPGRGTL
jgi:hypothetical protein